MIPFTKTSLLFSMIAGVVLLCSTEASAKCTVTFKFTNKDTHKITMLGSDSQARVNGLTWSKMNFNNVTIEPGKTGNATWTTNMSCGGNSKRDFRFKFQDSGDGNKYQESVDNVDIEDGLEYKYNIKND